MITQEQKNVVRHWFAHSVKTLPIEINQQVEAIGGRSMLTQRIDILYWVYYTEEEVQMYKEVLRLLDGEKDIDESLINAAIQHKKGCYQNTLEEIEMLKESIREKEERLRHDEEKLPQHSLSVDVLQEALKDYWNKG